jgi:hypothetical protein
VNQSFTTLFINTLRFQQQQKPITHANTYQRIQKQYENTSLMLTQPRGLHRVRNKNNIPRTCEMQNGEEHAKEKKFTRHKIYVGRSSPLGLRQA